MANNKSLIIMNEFKKLAGKESVDRNAVIAGALFILNTAYPAVTKNFSDDDIKELTALWNTIFCDIEPEILNEAVIRFVKNDRKGFFPAPGQVMGHVEQIAAEREAERKRAEIKARHNEETIQAACDYISLTCGENPVRAVAERIAAEYGDEYIQAIMERLYGGD